MRYLLALGFLAVVAAPAHAQLTFNVNTLSDLVDVPGACTTPAPPYVCSVRAAIQEANRFPGSTINIPAGFYRLTILGADEEQAASGDLDITANVNIVGAVSSLTIIDGGAIDRVLHIPYADPFVTVTISGLTVQNGSVDTTGGGIFVEGSSLVTLQDVNVVSNQAMAGAGIYVQGTLVITQSTISNNTAKPGTAPAPWLPTASGGGIFVEGTATLQNVVIRDNRALTGGGLQHRKNDRRRRHH